jgi:hypothetical protein
MEQRIITRKELYDLIWSNSLTKLSNKYAISTDGIKKLCKDFEIPVPKNGYWSKIKHNKKVLKQELSNDFQGEDKIILTVRKEGSLVNLDQKPLTILTKQIESDPKTPIKVPEKLLKPDILIKNTKDAHSKRKDNPYSFTGSIDTVAIYVEESNFNRALLIMDTFIKLLRYRGHSFKRDKNNLGPRIIIKEIEFPFHMREVQKRIPPVKLYASSTYVPTGILLIKIGESFKAIEYKDGAAKLENQLSKIVAKLELEADKEVIWKEVCRLHAIKREEERKIEQEFKARKEKEIIKTKKLFSDAEKFDKATIYRNYIEATEQKAVKENNLTEEVKEWIKWAKDKADWFDPLTGKDDELLNENDKREVSNPKPANSYYRF